MNEISSIINLLFQIYYYMIIIYILMSWLPNLRENFIGELLGKLVEPYLSPFRRIIPPLFGTLDISPIIALFVLRFAVVGLHSIVAMLFG
ncbi:YggT family protein [Paenibacillus typhae]|uniref:YggT family protein n=1 Tax=Paenibacillus typhae TaxID=1174501 RepID=UPI0021AD8AE1|nr:YggT family protein [Paenibacillus typhae]